MRFDLLQSISIAGDAAKANDDRCGCGDALAWVIDGATDLGAPGLVGSRGGAAWIAMEADAAFAAADEGDVRSICDAVFVRLARRFDAVRTRDPASRWELPSAAFLVARVAAQGLEIGWLGDCAILIRRGDTVEHIGPLDAMKDVERDHAAGLAEHGLGDVARTAPIIDSLRERRERADRFVLGIEPAMADHIAIATVPALPGDEVLLMSDGFSALIGDYAALSAEVMMTAIGDTGLAPLIGKLREIEHEDADCMRFPRFKRSDDATALWLRIVA